MPHEGNNSIFEIGTLASTRYLFLFVPEQFYFSYLLSTMDFYLDSGRCNLYIKPQQQQSKLKQDFIVLRRLDNMSIFHQKDHRQELIERLKEDYINELQLSEQLKYHAETARYPQFCAKLLSLAESEKKQAAIIKGLLEKLSAAAPNEIPAVSIERVGICFRHSAGIWKWIIRITSIIMKEFLKRRRKD